MTRMARGSLKAAPYNPRVIDAYARHKLETNLRKVGMVAPITVNKRTGHVVGGHQRLAALDALEGTEDYALDVALVDLDEKAEKQQNLFLNNPSAQGQWDLDALSDMLRGGELTLEAAGFDLVDLETLYPDGESWLASFRLNAATEKVLGDLDALAQDAAPEAPAPDPVAEAEDAAKRYADAMRQKAAQKDQAKGEDTETYAVVIFNTRGEREDFMELLGVQRGDRYVAGARVMAALARG